MRLSAESSLLSIATIIQVASCSDGVLASKDPTQSVVEVGPWVGTRWGHVFCKQEEKIKISKARQEGNQNTYFATNGNRLRHLIEHLSLFGRSNCASRPK